MKLGKDGVYRSYKAVGTTWEVVDWRALDPNQIEQYLIYHQDRDDNFTAWKENWNGVDGRDVITLLQLQKADDDLEPPPERSRVSLPRRSPLEDDPDSKSCWDLHCTDEFDCGHAFSGPYLNCGACDRSNYPRDYGCVNQGVTNPTCFASGSGIITCI